MKHSVPRWQIWSLALPAWLAAANHAGAAEPERGYRLGVGVGGFVQQQAYTDIDEDTAAFPMIYFENDYVRFFGGQLDVKLPSIGPLKFAISADYQADGYEPADSPALAGMKKREGSVWAGATALWRNGLADLEIKVMQDAMNHSKGRRAEIGLTHEFNVGRFQFAPRVTGIWLDNEYVDYYYSVRSTEARIDRPAYRGDATFNIEVGLRTTYRLDDKQSLIMVVNGERLGEEIKDSPITDRSSHTSLVLGYLYMF